jgi:mRNA interferase MazF
VFNSGDVVVATVKLEDTKEARTRPVLVLFEEYTNVVVAGITSNPYVKGIPISKKEGALKHSTIKLNQIFTLERDTLSAPLFKLSDEKRRMVFDALVELLSGLSG